MSLITTREVRQALVGKGNLRTRISDLIQDQNPYNSAPLKHIQSIYASEARRGWRELRRLFDQVPVVEVLENSWACIEHLSEVRDFFSCGVMLEEGDAACARLRQLQSDPRKTPARDVSISEIVNSTDECSPPDLFGLSGLSHEVRVRWGLAHRVWRRASHHELLKVAGAFENLGLDRALALFKEALAARLSSADDRRVSRADATLLSDFECEILFADADVYGAIYKETRTRRSTERQKVQQLRDKFSSDTKLIKDVLSHLGRHELCRAGELAEKITVDATAKLAGKHALVGASPTAVSQTVVLAQPWTSMSLLGHSNLVKIFGRAIVPTHWLLSAEQISDQLLDGSLKEQALSLSDIKQLGRSWSVETKDALLGEQRYKVLVVDDAAWKGQSIATLTAAANARSADGSELLSSHFTDWENFEEILQAIASIRSKAFTSLMQEAVCNGLFRTRESRRRRPSWEHEVLGTQIGTPAWNSAVQARLIPKPNLSQLVNAATSGFPVCDTVGFKDEAIVVLKRLKQASKDDAVSVMEWISSRPLDAAIISANLSGSLFKKICELRPGQCSAEAIRSLYRVIDEKQRHRLWSLQLSHVVSASHLLELALDGISEGWKSSWVTSWKTVEGSDDQKARALVLLARNDVKQLRSLHRKFTDEVLSSALRWCASASPKLSSFEVIFLELSSRLGLRHAGILRWLLSNRSLGKPAGHKFDHLYTKYEIKKKSGGLRQISAPLSGLKSIQKSVAVAILSRLDAHAAAFGFVSGRSIVDNARLHVGKEVVVNVDVKDCFPSTRWPLVRSALMRDLSDSFSPQTISFLVDLCTAGGVLPTGAPTSPALLNRVLFMSDEVLDKQARKRGCSYSRYADDLTFSGCENVVSLIGVAKGVLAKIGLHLDPKKTNIFRRGRRQMCTGLVVNDKVNVPRRMRKNIRAAVHAFEQSRAMTWNGDHMTVAGLRGRLEFIKMVAPEIASTLVKRFGDAHSSELTGNKKRSARVAKSGRA